MFKISLKSERKSKYAVKHYFSDVLTTRYSIPCQCDHKILQKYSIMAYFRVCLGVIRDQLGGQAVFRQFWESQLLCLIAFVVGRNIDILP